ncbi:MAG: prepilin-type N-terminal cleavage/methylation domain-containing protein [Planctomycetaceae bacterium]|nr:prepilin-type N-terminal cleavage/methylation domain-containing protein [Planctomycetales bacterium]MCB9925911.1 prepilin-type N-terminal cleavage/methylation domain-containing protein [Planctomycetaceae bacterium]
MSQTIETASRVIHTRRRSFTLVELLIVVSIISVMASAVMFALFGVMEEAKASRTKSQIAKLHSLIMTQWETYQTRAVRLPTSTTGSARAKALLRLYALRELMRLELPDRITDVQDAPITGIAQPSLWRAYRRRLVASVGTGWFQDTQPPASATSYWSFEHQGAECLYLIIANLREGDTKALDFFKESEIGDVDGDGMSEILDGWGNPIEFLRWAPGFATLPGPDGAWGDVSVDDDGDGITDNQSEAGAIGSDDISELQSRDVSISPDPFDLLRLDSRWADADMTNDPYALYPLIYSAGPDQIYGIDSSYDANSGTAGRQLFHYANPPGSSLKNDPYHIGTASGTKIMFGRSAVTAADNLSNHGLGTE